MKYVPLNVCPMNGSCGARSAQGGPTSAPQNAQNRAPVATTAWHFAQESIRPWELALLGPRGIATGSRPGDSLAGRGAGSRREGGSPGPPLQAPFPGRARDPMARQDYNIILVDVPVHF